MMNRRKFLMGGAAASALLSGSRHLSADPLGLPIGCQTYPVRKSIRTDFAGTMKGLSAAGFTQIELCSPYGYDDFSSLQQYKPQELRRMLANWGLGCISAHWAATELFQKPDESIAYAKEFGMTQMAIAALGPFRSRTTETVDDVKRYVEPFNVFAEKAHAAGIVALLHNEGFVSEHIDGKPVYDMMIAELNPATTKLQFHLAAGLRSSNLLPEVPGSLPLHALSGLGERLLIQVWLPPGSVGPGGRGLEGSIYSCENRWRKELLR
jgi:hypothetical protein